MKNLRISSRNTAGRGAPRPGRPRPAWGPAPGLLLALLLLLSGGQRAAAQCAAVTNLAAGAVTGNSAQLTFAPSASAGSYTVSYTTPSTGAVVTLSPNPTAAPVALTSLSPATGYTATVTSNCAGGMAASATVSFATVALNDEPCTATVLPLSGATCQPVASTSAGATPTPANGYGLVGCAGSQSPNDVWFAFTTAAAGSGPACTGASGPGGPAPDLAVAGLSPATTYYAAVSAYGTQGATGPFTICVSDPPACAAPLNVAVGRVTATTAQLTLAPGPGNTSYAVRYYPTATPAAALTLSPNPTSAPITITGLQPFTDYTVTLQGRCGSTGARVVFTRTFSTTNAQDEPADAVALPVAATCQPVAATNAGTTTTVPNGYTLPTCGGTVTTPADIWYTVTTDAAGPASQGLSISVSGVPAGVLTLFSSANGAAGPFTPLGCSMGDTFVALVAAPPLTVLGLAPNTTYYLSVAPAGTGTGSRGGFSICATPPLPCPAPTGLSASAVTSTSAQLSWAVPGPATGTFTVEYGPLGFVPGTGAAGAVAVPGLTGLSYAIGGGLQPGRGYEFYVSRDCGGAGTSLRSGPARFFTPGQPTTPPPNDLPCNAIALALGGATCQGATAGTLRNASRYFADPTVPKVVGFRCGTNGNSPPIPDPVGGNDVWYSFTTAAAGSGPASTGATVTVSGGTQARIVQVLAASTACGGPYVVKGCSESADRNLSSVVAPLVVTGLTPATTYYVAVCEGATLNRYGQQTGTPPVDFTFSICVTEPLACPPPTSVAYARAVTSTEASITFNAAAGAGSYLVTATPTAGGPPVTLAATGSPAQLTGLTPNTAYTVCVAAACGSSAGNSPEVCTALTTLRPGPSNYLCTAALPIACGQTVVGTHANVPQVAPPPNLPGGFRGIGVYYGFTGTGDSISVSTCNQNTRVYGGGLAIYSGSCANLSLITATDGDPLCSFNPTSNPNFPYFTTSGFRSAVGTQYYIYVSYIDPAAAGPFGLSLRCIPLPCPAPGAVAIANLTATTASVSFTPAANSTAPGYTVRAVPTAGGPPITQSGTGSPIVLTGLAPNTGYSVTVVANCTVNATSAASAAVLIRTPLASRTAALAALVDLYPNPAHHGATLAVPAQLLRPDGGISVVLFDGLGRAVRTLALPASTREQRLVLELADLPPGLYVLRLSTARGPVSKPLVIE